VAKSAWGEKHTCQSCGVVFYDLKKNPAICPECNKENTFQPLLKPRRGNPVTARPKPKPVPEPVPEPKQVDEESNDDDLDVDVDVDDDTGLIADTSDLGDEEDDVSEVREHIDSGDKD
jgi:hypothetical protein